jgi:hypothetical protein
MEFFLAVGGFACALHHHRKQRCYRPLSLHASEAQVTDLYPYLGQYSDVVFLSNQSSILKIQRTGQKWTTSTWLNNSSGDYLKILLA